MCVYYTVDLRTPESYPARIQHAVRPAEEDYRFGLWVYLNEVAMRPDVVETVEIGGLVLLVVGIAKEANGHVGEWLPQSVSTSSQKDDSAYRKDCRRWNHE